MALFRRNKNTTIAELEEYYENQRKNRTGTAWLMAIASLLITVGVIAGLFYGGRWTYRVLTNNDTKKVTVVTDDSTTKSPETKPNASNKPSVESDGVVSDRAATTIKPNTVTVKKPSNNDIPDTGPGTFLVVFPLVAVVLGYFIARKRELNNL